MSRYDARLRQDQPDLFEQGTGGYCTHEACRDYVACQIGHAADEESFLARSILSEDDLAWCRRELARRNGWQR